jgi:hypothetical protein
MFAEAAGTAVARRISPPILFCLKDVLTERSHHSPMAADKRGELDAECGAGVNSRLMTYFRTATRGVYSGCH